MHIAFLGTGIMGGPMVANLLGAGFEVTVWNRTLAKATELGAAVAKTPAAAVADAESVHLCLKHPAAVEAVLFEGGVLEAMRQGQVLVDHGTTGVALTRRIAQVCAERGLQMLDAPISGGVEGAREATLAIMVGGDRAMYERVLPALNAMGKTVRHVGPSGSGQALKLANQLLVIVHQFAAAEAFAFARDAGVNANVFAEIITNAWGRGFILERSLPSFLDQLEKPGQAPLGTLLKDAGLIAESAAQPLPVFDAAKRLLGQAVAKGWTDDDIATALRLYSAAE